MSPTTRKTLATILNQQHLCESLTVKEVETLLDFTEFVTFDKDAVVANAGDIGDALYFVIKGEAALMYDDSGREMEVGRMVEGELMGEMSFFDRKPRMLEMRALRDDTQVLKLNRKMYDRLRVEYPYIAVNLLEQAIISLDHLIRRMGEQEVTLNRYMFGPGRK